MNPANLEAAKERMLRDHLRRRGIHDSRVLDAMARVPRERFIHPQMRAQAYADCAIAIRCGQTISQPYMVALMTEALQCTGQELVLEIGTGSGYQTAILAEVAREVVSIERHAELLEEARVRLAELGYQNTTLIHGDGSLGWPQKAPYDRILVAAAAAQYPPPLFEQLAEGGILVMPVGGADHQILQAIHKTGAEARIVELSACRFVPLIGAQGWPEWRETTEG
jgi:protein-L-isoaspartate(D-aspartate) O-methyltransferase